MKKINSVFALSTIGLAVALGSGCNSEDLNQALQDLAQEQPANLDTANLPAGFDPANLSEDLQGYYDSTSSAEGRSVGSICDPSEEELHVLDVVNEARATARYCGTDFYVAADPLVWNCQLEQSSLMHTEDMVTNNFFAHEGSDGLRAGDRIEAAGYHWKVYGENLAAGHDTIEAAMVDLLESPGHCANIMSSRVEEFGSAVIYPDPSLGLDYRSYRTHNFATHM